MSQFLIIGLGGAIGSMLRYAIGLLSLRMWSLSFPWGTLTVNVIGSLCIGIFMGLMAHFQNWSDDIRLFCVVGILGGFTTFSSFSLDAVALMERGQYLQSALYITGSVTLSIMATCIGLFLTKVITG